MNHRDFENEIDAKLTAPGQIAMRDAVRALPEDSPSMAWRSGLNERLIAEAARRRRRARFFWALRPAAGLAFAGALAALFVFRSGPIENAPATSNTGSLEAQLLATHTQVATFADVAGTGVRPSETRGYDTREVPTEGFDWSEVDVESL